MKKVLHKFVTTKGVLGACVLDPEYGVFKSHMPPQFGKDRLQKIGRNLAGLADLARSDFSDPKDISFFFEKAALRIQDFNEGYHFIALFSPEMDRDVLDKAAGTFIHEFDQAITSPRTISLVKPTGGGQGRKTREQSGDALSPEGLMGSETLAGPLDKMQSALFKVVGPIAKMIFHNALEQWVSRDTPCMESLPLLTDIVSEEIGDAGLAKGFKEKLPSFCCAPPPNFRKKSAPKNRMKVVQNL